jgi:hypothetical protein
MKPVIVVLAALVSAPAWAKNPHPIPHAPRDLSGYARPSLRGPSPWTPLTNQPTFLVNGAANPILLTDGTVLVQDGGFPDWWKLTPDANGSYVNGTWSQVASLPALSDDPRFPVYSPLYHSSAVLPDGRLIIEGGEYLLNADQTDFIPTWTAHGAIYDPVANIWTLVAPPAFFNGGPPHRQTIGDAQSVVLANGTYMQANCCTTETALLDAKSLTWTQTGAGKFDINDEEGWTLLPSGHVLTVDAYVFAYDRSGRNSELYDPATGSWSSAGDTVVQLWDSCGGANGASYEVGPGVLRPDGTVFYTGASGCGSSNTAIYDTHTGSWHAGPAFPAQNGIADGPAALEPNGNVLMMASPLVFATPVTFFEWDGQHLTPVQGTPNAPFDSSFFGNMLVLPTGQILLTDFSDDIEIYTPASGPTTGAPVIVAAPTTIKAGKSYSIAGVGFNGLSQGAAYGDDAQAATNYPLVRTTNLATGHVQYSRTHDHSSMAVASDAVVTTRFDVPRNIELGPAKLEVVANGIASAPLSVTVTR